MNNELVISATATGTRIALLQNKQLVEYHVEEPDGSFTVGDIYLGTVRKVVSGLNAAFVDIGYEKDAFLHYLDLGGQIGSLNKLTKDVIAKRSHGKLNGFKLEQDIDKHGKIDQVLTKNQPILVQVTKEPISTKGPRLSCDISIAGRYAVLVPFANSINISKKITDKADRQRLQKLMSSIKPPNFGVIVRTVAANKDVEELETDLRNSIKKWDEGMKLLREAKPRDLIIGEMNRASSILRDLLNDTFDSITVDTKELFDDIKHYIHTIAPEKEKILKLHSSTKNKLFEQTGLEKQIKSLFGRSVSLAGGGYLIIEHTEALHVIDVNSGNKSSNEVNQEDTALHTNLEAVKEIARQLRLRDIGGIIVVDFIDMRKTEHRKQIQDAMQEEMKADRSKFTILPLSKFGLMQITRQRVRPELNIVTREACPTCNGTGTIQASILVSDVIENNLDYILTKQNESKVSVTMHPYLHAYFTRGFPSIRLKWFWKYKKWVTILKDSSLGVTDFRFNDEHGEDIEVSTN